MDVDSSSGSVAVGDFNNDTRLDIAVANSDGNNVGVLLGFGNGSFTDQVKYPTGSVPSSIAIGDLNNDNQQDIVVANWQSTYVSVLLGYGNGSFTHETTYSKDFNGESVAVADFNNDTRLDMVLTAAQNVLIFLGCSDEVFVRQTTLTSGNDSRPRSFVIGDLNNDDRMDIVTANSIADNIGIFLGLGNISFTNPVLYSTSTHSSPCSIAIGDFNKDTRLDIIVTNYGSDNVGIFLEHGNGYFINQTTYSTGPFSSPYSVAVCDFNNDTTLDVIIANYVTNNVVILLGYGDGIFGNLISLTMKYGSHPFFLVVGDFNNDRKVDFAVANSGTDSMQIVLQTC